MDSWLVVVLVLLAAATLVVAVVLVIRLFRMRALIRSAGMPMSGKAAFWAAVIYSVSPVDLLPDPIYLDDIGILLGAITYVGHLAKRHGIIGRRPAPARVSSERADRQHTG